MARIDIFLTGNLKLTLYPKKVFLKTYATGMDFLGWVHFPHHRQIRTTTKRRIFKRLADNPQPATINSYRGLLKHGDSYKIKQKISELSK